MSKNEHARHLDLIIDLTVGCRNKCNGCMVDLTGDKYPPKDDFNRLQKLVEGAIAVGLQPFDLILGPTDILSSDNREQVLTDPDVIKLLESFRFLSITVSFLNKDLTEYDWLASKLNAIAAGKGLTLTIPIKVGYLENPKYENGIRARLQYFTSQLVDIELNEVVTTIVYDELEIYNQRTKELVTNEMISSSLDVHFGKKKDTDFVIHHGRKGFQNILNKSSFVKSAVSLAEITRSVKLMKPGYSIAETNDLVLYEGTDNVLNYNNGKLYHRPFLMEHLPYFDPVFEVGDNWDVVTILQQRQERIVEGIIFSMGSKVCNGCPAVAICANRGVHVMMKHLNIDICITKMNENLGGVIWK